MKPLDREILTPVFTKHLGADCTILSVQRGPVGNGQEVWFVDTEPGARAFVVRRSASAGPLDWTDRENEAKSMAAAASHGLPVPAIRWSEVAPNSLGSSYFVMDRIEGTSAARASNNDARRAAQHIGRLLATLHSADISPTDIGAAPVDDCAACTRDEIGAWARRYHQASHSTIPMVDMLFARLAKEVAGTSGPPCLLWGDPGPHNALHDNGVVTALLDWELSRFGDPHEDLGALAWVYEGTDLFNIALEAYEEESSTTMDRDRITYFEVLACTTRSVMLITAMARYVEGRTSSPNLAGLGLYLVPKNLLRAGRLLRWPDPVVEDTLDRVGFESFTRPDPVDIIHGTALWLRETLLPGIEDPALRRGVSTSEALLKTAAARIEAESAVVAARRSEQRALLDLLGDAGVNIADGFTKAAVEVEINHPDDNLRQRVRQHVMRDAAAMRALGVPLEDLYGLERRTNRTADVGSTES